MTANPFHVPANPAEGDKRENTLRSAIALRDYSFRVDVSVPERRNCRTLMRAQAIRWRRAGVTGG